MSAVICENACLIASKTMTQSHCAADSTDSTCRTKVTQQQYQSCQAKCAPDVVDWSSLTADTLAALTLTDVAAATVANLQSLPIAACAGWTSPLLGQVGATCSGFAPACVALIPPAAMGGFTSQCADIFNLDQTNALTAMQFAQITPAAFAHFQRMDMLGDQCAGFTKEQMMIGPLYGDCSVLTIQCLQHIPVTSYAGIQSQCVASIQQKCAFLSSDMWGVMPPAAFQGVLLVCTRMLLGGAFAQITADQLAQVPPAAIPGFSQQGFNGINPPACAGFTGPQMAGFTANQCADIFSSCLRVLPAISGMPAECLGAIRDDRFAVLTAVQIAAFGPTAMNGITREQMARLGDQCQGLTTDIVSQWTGMVAASCGGMTSACMVNIPPATMGALAAMCLRSIPAASVGVLSAAQLTPMGKNIVGFMSAQLLILYAATGEMFIRTWTQQQQSYVNPLAMFAWNAGDVIKPTQTWTSQTNLTEQGQLDLSICTAQCMNAVFLSSQVPNTLPSATWGGLASRHVATLGAGGDLMNIAWLTDLNSWATWSDVGLQALTRYQVAALVEQVFSVVDPGNLSPSAMVGLTRQQMLNVPVDLWSTLPCENFQAFTPDQVVTLKMVFSAYDAREKNCAAIIPPKDGDHSTGGLSTGAKIGLGVGISVGVVALVAVVIAFCWKKKKQHADTHEQNRTEPLMSTV